MSLKNMLFVANGRALRHIARTNRAHPKLTTKLLSTIRLHSSDSTNITDELSLLPGRGVIEVGGRDCVKLLQGLMTHDMNLLFPDENNGNANASNSVLHSYFLNIQGRIVYDVFVYKTHDNDNNSVLIECDRQNTDNLIQHLKRYKLRSKVSFIDRPEMNVFTVFQGNPTDELTKQSIFTSNSDQVTLSHDPRLKTLGHRGLTSLSSPTEIRNSIQSNIDSNIANNLEIAEESAFKQHRFRLGISEGGAENEGGIPLEYNAALLNSVSFEKGCYVGQELIARAHFTGVIRKRVLPISLSSDVKIEDLDPTIYNGKGKRAGKLLGTHAGYGIALMRLKECLNYKVANELTVKSLSDPESKFLVGVSRPTWWPADLEY